ncbi:MAG: hypothetical protein HN333_14770 [Rhodospirillaceae bacterium]|nr:hypothetical protein [Rhodospirillaceae bacterium]
MASIDIAREVLGYEPNTAFDDGLEQTLKWFRDNWEQIDTSAEFPPGMSSAVKNFTSSKSADS